MSTLNLPVYFSGRNLHVPKIYLTFFLGGNLPDLGGIYNNRPYEQLHAFVVTHRRGVPGRT